MIRGFLVVIAIGIVLLAAGVFYLGMFPPAPPAHTVQTTIPTDKIQSH